MSDFVGEYKTFLRTLVAPEWRPGESNPAFSKRYDDWLIYMLQLTGELAPHDLGWPDGWSDDGLPVVR